jgi:hypothetical protein
MLANLSKKDEINGSSLLCSKYYPDKDKMKLQVFYKCSVFWPHIPKWPVFIRKIKKEVLTN